MPILTAKQQYWADHLQQADAFDGSVADYCRHHDLLAKTLYQWRGILRQREAAHTDKAVFTEVVSETVSAVSVNRLMDETPVQVLNELGRTARSQLYMWVQRGGPPDKSTVLFNYESSRSGATASSFLSGYAGALMTDGYTAYRAVAKANPHWARQQITHWTIGRNWPGTLRVATGPSTTTPPGSRSNRVRSSSPSSCRTELYTAALVAPKSLAASPHRCHRKSDRKFPVFQCK